jgi:hypothetical protein
MKISLVITSISAPNPVLKSFADGCSKNGWDFIVIGDKASPPQFELEHCNFFSLADQYKMPFKLGEILPEKHYARKNLGYLQAIKNGASIIVESDDDNFPYETFWEKRRTEFTTHSFEGSGWINLYKYFSNENIWPRGYPLEDLHKAIPELSSVALKDRYCPIQQGLADENPDVDAIYRLVGKLPVYFSREEQYLSLSKQAWCSFNSQNTTWFEPAFPLLYLPSYCSFRMTDIWRSYVATRISWENNWDVLFHHPTVWQERNAHNLMKDFADEIVGYTNNKLICERLEKLVLKGGEQNLMDDMISCYEVFTELKVVDQKEMKLITNWCSDLLALKNYKNG